MLSFLSRVLVPEEDSPKWRKSLIFLLFGYALFFSIVGQQPKEYSPIAIGYFLGVITAILTAQILIAYLVEKTIQRQILKYTSHINGMSVILTGFTIINSHYFVLIALVMPRTVKIFLGILFGLAIYGAISIRKMRGPVTISVITLLVISVVSYAWIHLPYIAVNNSTNLFPEHQAFLSHKIIDKRNVYLLFAESLVGERSLREFFNVTDAPHYRYLRQSGFRVLDGVSAGPASLMSHSRALMNSDDILHYAEAQRKIMSGIGFVPSYRIFMENGYRIQGLFPFQYLGYDTGVFDFAAPQISAWPAECMRVSPKYLYFGCSRKVSDWVDQYKGRGRADDYHTLLRQRVGVAAKSKEPWLTVSHQYPPDHTGKEHHWNNKITRKRFIEYYVKMLGELTDNLKGLIQEIRQHDSTGVIIVTGDHGTWLTRGLGEDEHPDWHLDRYGIGIAVSPADFCTDKLTEGMTTFHLYRHIVACLSRGEDAFQLLEKNTVLPNDLSNAINAIYGM